MLIRSGVELLGQVLHCIRHCLLLLLLLLVASNGSCRSRIDTSLLPLKGTNLADVRIAFIVNGLLRSVIFGLGGGGLTFELIILGLYQFVQERVGTVGELLSPLQQIGK